MGARGPKPDPAQAAKGYPGRRVAKADKVAADAAKLAALLAPSTNPEVNLPALLQDPKYQAAAVVWTRLAGELRRTHRLPKESEFFLVQLCIYAQEWVDATEDLHRVGFTQNVKTTTGGRMERRRPKTFDRQQAFSNMGELSRKFGLTPVDMYDLFKGQANAAATNPGLFGDERSAPQPVEQQPVQTGRIGGLGALRSTPPGERPN